MREAGGRTVLMDFGTGKELSGASDTHRPGTDDFAGTPLYVAPEVFESQPRTKRSEIYSLGVLLYHLVTNEYPVEGRSRAELEGAHKRGERKDLRDARPDLPEAFVHAVERALSVDPKERYASAGAFEAALARFNFAGDDRLVPRPWTVQSIAAVLAGAIGVAGAAYWLGPRLMTRETTTAQTSPAREQSLAAVARATAMESDYKIETAVYRERASKEQRLRPGEGVAPGDGLFVKLRVSVPAYVYIVNEDDRGDVRPLSVARPDRHESSCRWRHHPDSWWGDGFGGQLAGHQRWRTRALPHLCQPRPAAGLRGDVCEPAAAGTWQTGASAAPGVSVAKPPAQRGRPARGGAEGECPAACAVVPHPPGRN
jgi:Protein kinase domain